MVAQEASGLFGFIAAQIKSFLEMHHKEIIDQGTTSPGKQQALSLGFTFSFPAYQTSINSGVLLRWTKGFNIPSAVDKDICQLLQQEIDLLSLPVEVSALVNDALGAIMSRAYTLPMSQKRTSIGAIFGTGTNCVYLERLSNIRKSLEGDYDRSTGEMFISMEWGSFNNHLSVLPNTPYDVELDGASLNPGNQMFEKRVSGLFLGELLRMILVEMNADPELRLFRDFHHQMRPEEIQDSSPFHTRWAVDSSILSTAEGDGSEDLHRLRSKIEQCLGVPSDMISKEDAMAVKWIACAIGKRAARLAGMALGAVILQSGAPRRCECSTLNAHVVEAGEVVEPCTEASEGITDSQSFSKAEGTITEVVAETGSEYAATKDRNSEDQIVDIAVDGSLVEFYPNFEAYMREALRSIPDIGEAGEKSVRIGIARDGSGVGAAIIALLAAHFT